MTIEEVDALENAIRRLSPKLHYAINLRYREKNMKAQIVYSLTELACNALDALRKDRNVRRLGRGLIAEEWRRKFLYHGITPIVLE